MYARIVNNVRVTSLFEELPIRKLYGQRLFPMKCYNLYIPVIVYRFFEWTCIWYVHNADAELRLVPSFFFEH